MTNPVSRRRVLGVAGTAAGSFAVSGILSGKVVAKPDEFCDFVWPMTGRIIDTADSPGGITAGIKIRNESGTKVYASRAGEVTYAARIPANPNGPGRSYSIEISHENGYTTSYLTNATTAAVEEGDRVKRGQLIGPIGTGVDVPHLYFSIDRQENHSIPGRKNQRVSAGEMIRKDYPGIKCPNAEPGPGPIFNDLKDQKLALAERIETISGGMIQEKDQVQTVLGNLETAATNGTISFQEAANAVRRLKLGEEMTERTIVGAGPAAPIGDGKDYDIATKTAETVINTGISIVFSILPFSSIIKRIPFGDTIMRKAREWGSRAFQWLLKQVLKIPGAPNIFRRARKRVNSAGLSLYDDAQRHGEERASALVAKKTSQVNRISGPIAEALLNEIETGGEPVQRRGRVVSDATDLSEALAALNHAANPATGASFTGTLDGAAQAAEQGIADANQIFEQTTNTFETFDKAFDFAKIANIVLDVLSAVGLLTGGILSTLALLLDIILTIAKAVAGLVEAGVGWQALITLRDNHAQTLDSITTGTSS